MIKGYYIRYSICGRYTLYTSNSDKFISLNHELDCDGRVVLFVKNIFRKTMLENYGRAKPARIQRLKITCWTFIHPEFFKKHKVIRSLTFKYVK